MFVWDNCVIRGQVKVISPVCLGQLCNKGSGKGHQSCLFGTTV